MADVGRLVSHIRVIGCCQLIGIAMLIPSVILAGLVLGNQSATNATALNVRARRDVDSASPPSVGYMCRRPLGATITHQDRFYQLGDQFVSREPLELYLQIDHIMTLGFDLNTTVIISYGLNKPHMWSIPGYLALSTLALPPNARVVLIALPDPLFGGAYLPLRNGLCPPDLDFLNVGTVEEQAQYRLHRAYAKQILEQYAYEHDYFYVDVDAALGKYSIFNSGFTYFNRDCMTYNDDGMHAFMNLVQSCLSGEPYVAQ